MYDYIIIDANQIYARFYHSSVINSVLNNGAVVNVAGILGFLAYLDKVEEKYLKRSGKVYICFDNPETKHNFRHLISSEYKANRVKPPREFFLALDKLKLLLKYRKDNYILLYQKGLEADDIAANLVKIIKSTHKDRTVLLCSDDLDWAQYMNDTTEWLTKNERFTLDSFKAKYGFSPDNNRLTLYKCFRGDSDGISPAVPNIPTEHLIAILEHTTKVSSLILQLPSFDFLPEKWKTRIREAEKDLVVNEQLVRFIPISRIDLEAIAYFCTRNERTLAAFYKSLNIDPGKLDPNLNAFTTVRPKSLKHFKCRRLPRT